MTLDRRHLLFALAGLPAYSLLDTAQAAGVRGISHWVRRQDEIAQALARGEISGLAWAQEVEHLAASISVPEVLAALKNAQIADAGAPSYNDPKKSFVRFLDEDGKPAKLAYGAALFKFHRGNVITPHVHRHMVSAHMVIEGSFRIRNFDWIAEDGDGVILKPTRDYVAKPGEVSTMCTQRDNGHWFVPLSEGATTFDVVVSGLDAGAPDHEIRAIDPARAAKLGDGTIRASYLDFEESSRRYTSDV